MPRHSDLRSLKRDVSPALLRLRGVSGVGIAENALRVYLEAESEDVKAEARSVVATKNANVNVEFVVTGPLKAQ